MKLQILHYWEVGANSQFPNRRIIIFVSMRTAARYSKIQLIIIICQMLHTMLIKTTHSWNKMSSLPSTFNKYIMWGKGTRQIKL
jgi:hypothetical protein